MSHQHKFCLSLPQMLGWVLPIAVGVGVVGIYPTWLLGQKMALWAELSAGLIALVIMLLNAAVIFRSAKRGPAKVAFAFIMSVFPRVIVSIGLALAVWKVFELPHMVVLVWLLIFHLGILLGESIWLSKTLRRDFRDILLEQEISDGEPENEKLMPHSEL